MKYVYLLAMDPEQWNQASEEQQEQWVADHGRFDAYVEEHGSIGGVRRWTAPPPPQRCVTATEHPWSPTGRSSNSSSRSPDSTSWTCRASITHSPRRNCCRRSMRSSSARPSRCDARGTTQRAQRFEDVAVLVRRAQAPVPQHRRIGQQTIGAESGEVQSFRGVLDVDHVLAVALGIDVALVEVATLLRDHEVDTGIGLQPDRVLGGVLLSGGQPGIVRNFDQQGGECEVLVGSDGSATAGATVQVVELDPARPSAAHRRIHGVTKRAMAARFARLELSSRTSSGQPGSRTGSPLSSRSSRSAGQSSTSPGWVWKALP